MTPSRDRVLSGMRPTGQLHLGNYLGALENWVKLQDQFDCFYFVANWHVLTTSPGDIQAVPGDTIEMGADWLGAGLERVPTYKEMVEQLGIESPSYGLLGYPLLQAADILMYKAQWVPVGADQVPHIELTREVARRFNNIWKAVFPEPQAKLTEIPKVPGTDGRKMSKSYGNAIYLSDTSEEITAKVKPMVTDPARKRRTDPGNPDICPVFDLHRIFTPEGPREECATGCRTAAIGCLDCKGVLLQHMLPPLAQIRERRQRYVEKPTEIVEILHEGTKRARRVAIYTMTEVREAIKLEP